MQKQTAFYVASAAFAATILLTDDKASAASIVVQDGYQLLEKQNTVQTFDLAKEPTTRTINFSLPVDATTVKSNDNIVLFDVTASEKVTIIATVAANKTSVDVELAEGATYKEGHEYRLLIGSTIKNVATKAESLKQAIQFNYKTINVTAPPVAKPEGEQAASGTLSGTISSITASNVTIGDKSYSMSTPIAAFVAANKEVLAGADIKATLTDGNITSIEELTIVKDSAKLVGTDDAGVVKNTTITVAAENVTLHKLQFANLFVASTVKQALNVSDSVISGKTQMLTERTVQAVIEEQHATTLVIRFTNSVVVEMLIARADVKSEISGKSKVTLISVKANTNISIDPEVVLPKLMIEDGVTNIQLNASIAEVEVRTNNDIKVTGAGNFEKLNIATEKNVELSTTGTVKEIAVQNADATMTIGDKVTIESVKIPESMKPEDMITNYDDVKEKLDDKIEESELEEFVAAKFVKTDVAGVVELSVVGVSKKANVSYQHYNRLYGNNVQNVGEKLQNAQTWTKGTKVLEYFDRTYYVFVTDENGIITNRFNVQTLPYSSPVTMTQTDSTMTLHFVGYTKESYVADYVQNLYVTDGTKSEIVNLSQHQFAYDEHGKPSITIDTSSYNGDMTYSIGLLGNYYGGLDNIQADNKNYPKIVYDFAKRAKDSLDPYVFISTLADSNYVLVDYVSPAGEKYKVRESLLSSAPSMKQQYINAFSEKQYASVADIQQKVTELNEASKALITAYNGYVEKMEDLYNENDSNRLKEDVTLTQINELKAAIEADATLPQAEKAELRSQHQNVVYAFYRLYEDAINELTDDQGLLEAGVDEATIDALIKRITDDVEESYYNKTWWLERLQSMKREIPIQPLKKLQNYNWTTTADRLKDGVTPAQITAAYTQSLALTKDDTQKQRVESYYGQLQYYYIMQELAKIAPTIRTYDLFELNEGVTAEQIEKIFASFDQYHSSYEYEITTLKKTMLDSFANQTMFNYVTYVSQNREYVLKDGVTLQTFMPIVLAELQKSEMNNYRYQLQEMIYSVVNGTFTQFYDKNVLKSDVTKESIDALYKATLEILAGTDYEYDVTSRYEDVLYDYYLLQASSYYVQPEAVSTGNLLHVKEGTTVEQIEELFADVDVNDKIINKILIHRLKEQAVASIAVGEAMALLKPSYWQYNGIERVVDGKQQQLLAVLLELQKTTTNTRATSWINSTLENSSSASFTALTNKNVYADGAKLRTDVTLEQIQAAYEEAKTIIDNAATKSTYEHYVYYYYAKEASKLLEEPIEYEASIQLVKDDVTQEQIDAVFATWTYDETNTSQAQELIQQLKATMNDALAMREVLKLVEKEDVTDEAVTEQFVAAYTKLMSSDNSYQVRAYAQSLANQVASKLFKSFKNNYWQNSAEFLLEDVTLADLQAAYDRVKGLNEETVTSVYEEYVYYYYVREVFAATGVSISGRPIAFKKEASVEQINEIFAEWTGSTTNSYYGEDLNILEKYAKMSAELQPFMTLLHEEYMYSNRPLLADGVTTEQLATAYETVLAKTTNTETKQWLQSMFRNTILYRAFDSLENSSYDNEATRLRSDVTLADIQAIYDALARITPENELITLQYNKYETEYYYYLREAAALTGVTTSLNGPTVLKEGVTLESIQNLFKTWNPNVDVQSTYTRYINNLSTYLELSVQLQPVIQLLHKNYANYSEPLFADGVTLEQFVAAVKDTSSTVTTDAARNWLENDLMNTVSSKSFRSLENEMGNNSADVLREDVTLADIQAVYNSLMTIMSENYMYTLEETRYEYELYYYLREVAALTGVTNPMYTLTLFTNEASVDSIEDVFATWKAPTETHSYYAERITQFQKYATLSASMQPILQSLHPNYQYGDNVLAEGATLEQFVAGYKEAFDETDDAAIQQELRTLLLNIVMPKLFDELCEYDYDMAKYVLRENVTVETIETLYDTLLPIVAEEDRPILLSKKYELQYVYYTDQIEELTGVTNSIYSPIVFEKEVSSESIEALFKEWDAEAEYNDYRAKEITNLAKNVLISANIQPLLTLLHENYENYYGSELLKDDVTLEQFVTAYEKAFNGTEHEASKEWMKNLVSSHFVRKAFNHLQSDSYSNDFDYAKDDVTIANIRGILTELAPILSEQDAATLQQKQYRLEYSYYLKQLAKLAPGIQDDVYESYYKLADDVTLEQIEAALSDFEYTGDEYSYFGNIPTLKEKLITSYSVKELLVLIDNIDAEQPFKEDVTVEELKTAYEVIVARGDDTATGTAQQLLFNYINALGETVLYSMRIEGNYYGGLQPLATTEQVNGVIEKFTALQAFIVPENLAGAINHLNERKALLAFSALLVEGTNNVLKDDTTLQHIIDIYNTMDAELKDTDIHYEVDYLFRTYVDRYYQQQIQTVTGTVYRNDVKYVFANTPTLEDIQNIFNTMSSLSENDALQNLVQDMQANVTKNYYIQDLLALTDYTNWYNFKEDATIEQIQAAYDKAMSSEDDTVVADLKKLFNTNGQNVVRTIAYVQIDETSTYYVEPYRYTTIEDIKEVYNKLKAYQTILHDEQVAQLVASLQSLIAEQEPTEVVSSLPEAKEDVVEVVQESVPAYDNQVAVKEIVPVAVPADDVALQQANEPQAEDDASISLEQLDSYAQVADFIKEDDYGFTIAADADREALQAFADELEAALDGSEGQERLQLLLELVNDLLAEPVAFVPFSLA